ncbi:hypothetical protein GCG54_00006815 [Colletotrichum gloeosporioides]|uniref:Fungal N-terminal domain-containing protein n=1 Tax=Colletotrichum gloeosporioides TaxID=474922 RepID=A0A8H4CQM8_COLGL|nr:uncharacterized protein GCG54_00006815 [Colletotrichum gloeosporioides]KAF3808199.1 hypothetical protein GCG54_00006815 [Colletotrichum gloeosporioides]
MAEVLGTVVGVVSLGIQVSSAISAYIEGVQCRKDEVESTIRYRRSFQLLLTQIGTLTDNLPKSSVPSTIALEEALKAASSQILQLDSFLGKVLIHDSPLSFTKKKLFYPFRRDHLSSLDKKLQAINIALQSAMQLMELYETCALLTLSLLTLRREISMATQVSVCQVHEETSIANTMLLDIKADIARSIAQNQSHDLAIQSDMDELKSIVEALVSSSSDTMLTMQRLTSNPDVLKTVCSGISDVKPNHPLFQKNGSSDSKVYDEAENVYTSFYCNCDTRRRLNRKAWRSGPALLVKEVAVKRPHLPGCPLTACIDGQSKWTAEFSANLFRGLVSVAITITTSTILGAGGFSISPSFTYLSVRNTSPAREAIHLLGQAFNEREWSARDSHNLMWRAIRTIQTSFNSRTSSPFDIDSDGKTLLHDVLMIQINNNSEMPRNEILKFLAMAGVPRDHPDGRGIYPFQAAFGSMFYPQSPTPETLQMLCPDNGLLSLDIQQAGRVYDGHPSEPIVLRNIPALKHALDRNTSLSELATFDAFGNTSLNHLLSWPEGFKLVLDRFGRGVFDASGDALTLDYALLWSGRICTSERSTLCQSDCSCTNGLRLIMESDVECIAKATSGILWMISVLYASNRAREMVIGRLKEARQELKELALLLLAPDEIEKWDLRCSKAVSLPHSNEGDMSFRVRWQPIDDLGKMKCGQSISIWLIIVSTEPRWQKHSIDMVSLM